MDTHASWSGFDDAMNLCREKGMAGVGYAFGEDQPFAGIDLDNCRNPESGALDPWAEEWIAYLDSYAEISPSGTGVKVFVVGKLPGRGRRRDNIEIYDRARYFTVTGRRLDGIPVDIRQADDALPELYAFVAPPSPLASRPAVAVVALPDDADLIRRALAARNGDRFGRLWSGDQAGYCSQSHADLALCWHLAFWTGHDPDRIDRLFRQSGLCRPKWDRPDYRRNTIARAVSFQPKAYSGPGVNPIHAPPVFAPADPPRSPPNCVHSMGPNATPQGGNSGGVWGLVRETLPVGPAVWRDRLYTLAWRLKRTAEYAEASAEDVAPLAYRWHELAGDALTWVSAGDVVAEFTTIWDREQFPEGDRPLQALTDSLRAVGVPRLDGHHEPEFDILAALCRELGRRTGVKGFWLSRRTAAQALRVKDDKKVGKWLARLCRLGVIVLVSRGSKATGKASRYRLPGHGEADSPPAAA